MTVATLTDVLRPAAASGWAVAGLVVLGWEDASAYVEAAEEAGLPVILQAGPGCRKHMPVAVLGRMFRHLAEQARVPVVSHIDHALTLDECAAGIDAGFTSVMIDGSSLPLADNIALSARVVEMAHRAGVSVEGEVGVVGYVGGASSQHTTARDAAAFEQQTGIDALAVSVGNVHLSTQKSDGIDFAAIAAIAAVTKAPLVLHGGSGIPEPTRRQLAQSHRVAKFNVGTELRQAFGTELRGVLSANAALFDRNEILSAIIPGLRRSTAMLLRSLRQENLSA
jgi:fructose-bisphosphate aldolase, class II